MMARGSALLLMQGTITGHPIPGTGHADTITTPGDKRPRIKSTRTGNRRQSREGAPKSKAPPAAQKRVTGIAISLLQYGARTVKHRVERQDHTCGEVPEWSNGAVSKTVVLAIVPWVRIPPSPPFFQCKKKPTAFRLG